MHSKKVIGFNLIKFLRDEIKEENRREFFKIIQDDINSGGKMFIGSSISQEMSLEDWAKAMEQVENQAISGAVILKCC